MREIVALRPLIRLGLWPIHLLPQGEKGSRLRRLGFRPSTLAGEGAQRADEGYAMQSIADLSGSEGRQEATHG